MTSVSESAVLERTPEQARALVARGIVTWYRWRYSFVPNGVGTMATETCELPQPMTAAA